eukprot:scaffold63475_cov16-Tisochrysis_lutea.AAC.1
MPGIEDDCSKPTTYLHNFLPLLSPDQTAENRLISSTLRLETPPQGHVVSSMCMAHKKATAISQQAPPLDDSKLANAVSMAIRAECFYSQIWVE